jgi:hypothetical protein
MTRPDVTRLWPTAIAGPEKDTGKKGIADSEKASCRGSEHRTVPKNDLEFLPADGRA